VVQRGGGLTEAGLETHRRRGRPPHKAGHLHYIAH
jgi:hypothetical protein